MCRLIAYLGHRMALDEVLFKSKNSLVNQSRCAKETTLTVNGDGFGIGWYEHDFSDQPALFTSIQPAWNDRNLHYIAPMIHSKCFFAHVRAASFGHVSQYNCHPFHYENYLGMHNGTVHDFKKIKRMLRAELPTQQYDWIQGLTDTEHMLALFFAELEKQPKQDVAAFATCFNLVTDKIAFYKAKANIAESPSYVNIVVGNGFELFAARYVSDPKLISNTLYYAAGSRYVYEDEHCHMEPSSNGKNQAVLISSEKLNDFETEWHQCPVNHALLVNRDLAVAVQPLVSAHQQFPV